MVAAKSPVQRRRQSMVAMAAKHRPSPAGSTKHPSADGGRSMCPRFMTMVVFPFVHRETTSEFRGALAVGVAAQAAVPQIPRS